METINGAKLPDGFPAVSVVVPCRNEARNIAACVYSLLQQQAPPGGYEIIVADGLSEDGTRSILEKISAENPVLRVIDNPLRITPCGMNCGIKAARGRWIAIMGSHNRYAPDYLLRAWEAAERTGADNVGGAMFTEAEGLIPRAIALSHHSPFSVGGARWHDTAYEGPADTVFGGFYRREVFDRIGLFDEELVRNQDDELNLRLTRSGGKIWQTPLVKSWYQPRKSLSALFSQYKQYGYWKVRVIQKHRLPASWRHLIPGTFVLGVLLLALALVLGLLGMLAGAWRAGVPAALGLCLATCLGSYGVLSLSASVLTAKANDWSILPVLPLVFLCYHWGYGYGFLRGAWDFLIRKRTPGTQFSQLTRIDHGPVEKNAEPTCKI
ncbi:MAG TPA: glycosyltransferase family 2 protein [Verrucomicrobiae bacterium]|nr:glycosyltransferase family 2 protein [Verrucomicrobiae bacterium]